MRLRFLRAGAWLLAFALAAGARPVLAQTRLEATGTVRASATIVSPVALEARSLSLNDGTDGASWLEADLSVRAPGAHAVAVVVAGSDGSTEWTWRRSSGMLTVPAGGERATRTVSYVVAVLY